MEYILSRLERTTSRFRRTSPLAAFVIPVSSLLSLNRGWSRHTYIADY